MPLSTFAARTFRADTFVAPLGQQPEVAQPPKKNTGGTVLPFRRRVETPQVSTEVQTSWQLEQPIAVVPPAIFRPPLPEPAVKIYPVVYPDPLPEIQRTGVSVSTPQFLMYAQPELAEASTSSNIVGDSGTLLSNYGVAVPGGSAVADNRLGAGLTFHNVLPPSTVRNLTDEELVAVALGMI